MSERDDHTQVPQPALAFGLTGWAVIFVAYTLVFSTFGRSAFGEALLRSAFNTVPAMMLSWPVAQIVRKGLMDRAWPVQAVGHAGLAVLFGLLWYIGIQVGYGLRNGLPEGGIVGRPLFGAGLTWQLFQGVTLYSAIAMFACATTYRERWLSARAELDRRSTAPAETPPKEARQIFVKDGKAVRPVALSDIWLLSGAGDYTEILTADGTFLSGTSLSEFEAELPKDAFLRVHRSHIVATDAVRSIEPGGNGRLTLHLPNGHSVTTSRSGAGRFKALAI